MPSIIEIPCEVIGEILKNLGDLASLDSAILTCRHFYNSYRESHGVEATILSRQITPALLPYSIAQIDAEQFSSENGISLLEDLRRQPASHWVLEMKKLPKAELRRMSRLHNVVHKPSRAW